MLLNSSHHEIAIAVDRFIFAHLHPRYIRLSMVRKAQERVLSQKTVRFFPRRNTDQVTVQFLGKYLCRSFWIINAICHGKEWLASFAVVLHTPICFTIEFRRSFN